MSFNVVSTFSGCGGSSLGYKLAGANVLLAVEWDDNAVETYKMNFPQTPVFHGDIHTLSVDEVLSRTGLKPGELDLLDGSPPCQGFSTSGKRNFLDNRNELFKEYSRLLRGLQPKTFVMENVSGMVKGKMKLMFREILIELKSCGYRVSVAMLNAENYGVPQSRNRMIFIGVRNDLNIEPSHPRGNNRLVTVREAFRGLKDYEDRPMPDWLKKVARCFSKPICGSTEVGKLFKQARGTSGGSIGTILLDWNKPSSTIIKSEIAMCGLIHPNRHRYLNIDELKRLGAFPDDFKFTDRKNGNERIGNSVPPLLMKAIASHIKTHILDVLSERESSEQAAV